jgi:glycyl-radical enzyme activating protein
MNVITGRVFDIQRFSIHDGPGIRTTVFLKGCPLRCLWCGNPESIPTGPSLSYISDKCIACGACFDVCSENALKTDVTGKAVVDRARCQGNGACAQACDPKALEIVGRDMTAAEVLEVVWRDEAYYASSGGGMTLSGGEPLMQPDFAKLLLIEAKARGVHTAVETSGYALWGAIRSLLPLVDLWLFDYKETDPRLHETFVGKPRELVVSNLNRLHDAKARILLRCPMIPKHNARRDHLDGIVSLTHRLPRLQGVELLPYYDMWRAKLKRFGLPDDFPGTVKPPPPDTVKKWQDYLRDRNVKVIG